MSANVLQPILKFALNLGAELGIAFMMICTIFVIICIINGGIKIRKITDETKDEKNNWKISFPSGEVSHIDGTHDRVCSYPIKNYLMGVGERLIPHNKKIGGQVLWQTKLQN